MDTSKLNFSTPFFLATFAFFLLPPQPFPGGFFHGLIFSYAEVVGDNLETIGCKVYGFIVANKKIKLSLFS